MFYIGMDVHKATTTYCILDGEGVIVRRGTVPSDAQSWKGIVADYPRDNVRVVFEVVGMANWLVDVMRECGIEPVVVDVRKFKLISTSKKKTDKRDAYVLAEALRTGLADNCSITIASERAQRARALIQARSKVVKEATIARNAALGLLRSVGVNTFTKRSWASGEKWGVTLALPAIPEWMRPLLETHRAVWSEAQRHRVAMDAKVTEELKLWPETQMLEGVPGYGPIVSLTVLSSIDDPHRFGRPRQVGSYAGMVPAVRDSGGTMRRGRITREGRSLLRHAMVQAGHSALRSKYLSPALKRWANRMTVRRGCQITAVALGRRLLVLGCRLLQNGEIYNPLFGAEQVAQ